MKRKPTMIIQKASGEDRESALERIATKHNKAGKPLDATVENRGARGSAERPQPMEAEELDPFDDLGAGVYELRGAWWFDWPSSTGDLAQFGPYDSEEEANGMLALIIEGETEAAVRAAAAAVKAKRGSPHEGEGDADA